MKPLANMIPISVMATGICDNFGDSDRKYFGEHLKNIIFVYKKLHIFLLKNVSVQTITLSPDNISDLPCDFIRETKIGVINKAGRIATFRIDKNLRVGLPCTTHSQVEAALASIDNNTASSTCFSFYNAYDQSGGYIGELRGHSCSLNNLGYFNVDRENGVLIVSPNLPPGYNIIMEYMSDGVSNGLELVPTELEGVIVNKSKAIFCLDKKDNRAPEYEETYRGEYRDVKKLYTANRIDAYAKLFKTLD